MKRNRIAALCFLVSLTVASCSKFSNGDPVTETRNIGPDFKVVSVYNNVNVKLIESEQPRLELTCPANLIGNIATELSPSGDTLIIRNDNTFNWLRSFDYSIDLTVYYKELGSITYASNGSLVCTDSIRGYIEYDSIDNPIRTFELFIHEGSGDIDLTFCCDVLRNQFNNGTPNVTLRGKVSYSEHLLSSYGVVHAENLQSNFIVVQSQSTNDTYVWAVTGLRAMLHNIGNLYYIGNPSPEYSSQTCTSTGRVIKLG